MAASNFQPVASLPRATYIVGGRSIWAATACISGCFPPEQVPFSEPMSEVMSHGKPKHMCLWRRARSLLGGYRFGQLGLDRGDKSKPYLVSEPTSGMAKSTWTKPPCGRRSDNNIYCWGANESLISLATNKFKRVLPMDAAIKSHSRATLRLQNFDS